MKITEEIIQTSKTVYEAQDGKKFDNRQDCLNHESCMRGKLRVRKLTFEDETRRYFYVPNTDNYEHDYQTFIDCLNYLSSAEAGLCSNFTSERYPFEAFRGKWLFTDYDIQGEFYRLITGEELKAKWDEDLKAIQNDLDFLEELI